jgi:hypothetical protein
MAGGAHAPALDQHLDVVPMVERDLDLPRGLVVPGAHVLHGGVGEHDAPAEGIVGVVALDHRDAVLGMRLFHQQAEIQPGRAAADTDDAHDVGPASFDVDG